MNKKNTMAILLNTNRLGGAERSLIEQFAILPNKEDFTFFIPILEANDDSLENCLQEHNFFKIVKIYYPKFIYKISRSNPSSAILSLIMMPGLIFYIAHWIKTFNKFNHFYINGNKAALPAFSAIFFRQKGIKVFWHFRDFPSGLFFKIISTLLNYLIYPKKNIELKIIANSNAVKKNLDQIFPNHDVRCIYNLTGDLPDYQLRKQIKTIGIVSMLAPWKGLHAIVLMISLYEKELKELGIENFYFFGDDIYQTTGLHNNYAKEIQELSSKLGITYPLWVGRKDPKFIFSHIDLLIHSSLDPEPFGRVIAESFKSGPVVLSTALGGASELIGDSERGLVIYPYDHAGLFNKIKLMITDANRREEVTSKAKGFIEKLEKETLSDIVNLFA